MNKASPGSAGSRDTLSAARGPPRSGIGFGLTRWSPRWLLISDEVTSAVPGGPDRPGKRKAGLARPLRWQVAQLIPVRAAWPPSSKGARNAARPIATARRSAGSRGRTRHSDGSRERESNKEAGVSQRASRIGTLGASPAEARSKRAEENAILPVREADGEGDRVK